MLTSATKAVVVEELVAGWCAVNVLKTKAVAAIAAVALVPVVAASVRVARAIATIATISIPTAIVPVLVLLPTLASTTHLRRLLSFDVCLESVY